MDIIGICRFSLVGRGDWKAWREGEITDEAAAAQEQAARLFTPERMEARLATFEHLTLASLAAQTDPDFAFLVLASELMPEPWRGRLVALCRRHPQVVLRFSPPATAADAQKAAFAEMGLKLGEVLQFRLDDDDALHAGFIDGLRRGTEATWQAERAFAASFRGVMYCVRGGATAGIHHWPVDFFSAGAALRHPSKSVYEFGHFALKDRFKHVILEGHLALVTNNGLNDTSMTPLMMQRRGLVPMTPEAVEAAVARDFPFLDVTGRWLAGMLKSRAEVLAHIGLPALEHETPEAEGPGRWLTDFAEGPRRRGFFVSDESFALQHTRRGDETLYVSFDNLSGPRSPVALRDPWGYAFAEKRGWSNLGVLAHREHWFREPRLFDELTRLRDQGFFARFGRVILSGTSMGGFAACAFAPLVPGAVVIAFSPQSTLDPARAGFDRRYRQGARLDWSGPFADGAEGVRAAGRAYVVFDPRVPEDRRHADRLAGPGVTLLRARHSGHFTAQFLRQTGLLSGLVTDCAAGSLTEAGFYARYRQTRGFRRYLGGLVAQAEKSARPARQAMLARALQGAGRPQLANQLLRAMAAPQ
ncbi:glycosyltransferase [Frigidibacter sp. MR17.14]|uniref:glycosyltransferase n=1 Tax=Frigidibacter sp. MR17.14 TaxID=3126509 RepID=UPI003012E056